jgi:hypothetical protein
LTNSISVLAASAARWSPSGRRPSARHLANFKIQLCEHDRPLACWSDATGGCLFWALRKSTNLTMVRFVDFYLGRQGRALESERQAAIRATPVKF